MAWLKCLKALWEQLHEMADFVAAGGVDAPASVFLPAKWEPA